jgi:hypothetical protein
MPLLARLDRHRSEANVALERVGRGDLVVVDPLPLGARARIEASTRVLGVSAQPGTDVRFAPVPDA